MNINEIKTIIIDKANNRYNQQLIGIMPDYKDLIVSVYMLNVCINKEALNENQLTNIQYLFKRLKYGK